MFFCSLDVLYGGIGIGNEYIAIFYTKKIGSALKVETNADTQHWI
jgi:hypothetical protein